MKDKLFQTAINRITSPVEKVKLVFDVVHFSTHNTKTEINLEISADSVTFVTKNSKLLRNIPLAEVEALTLSEESSEMVIHVSGDADERISCY